MKFKVKEETTWRKFLESIAEEVELMIVIRNNYQQVVYSVTMN